MDVVACDRCLKSFGHQDGPQHIQKSSSFGLVATRLASLRQAGDIYLLANKLKFGIGYKKHHFKTKDDAELYNGFVGVGSTLYCYRYLTYRTEISVARSG